MEHRVALSCALRARWTAEQQWSCLCGSAGRGSAIIRDRGRDRSCERPTRNCTTRRCAAEITRWHERINIRGERIALPLDGPLGEAAWMKERIARARQALPNGYCGLPLVQTCPHPNACLSCDNFLTDGSFRAVHEQQLQHTGHLRERAGEQGRWPRTARSAAASARGAAAGQRDRSEGS